MSEPIIHVRDVYKSYRHMSFRPSFRHEARQLLLRMLGRDVQTDWQSEPFWALQGISFDVYPGESVALIGRNGAGKTTLLRLLSNVTAPTSGTVEVTGRFASLIGLGTGFNPQRTGRENIFLNCAIYGVHPREVNRFIDDIIAFSELGDFIDQPVKLYSSGMTARLGFSIAIHILPDMIFLDEILTVGDAAFQEKCAVRIKELREQNTTMLYVSHNMAAVRKLCDRAIVLHHGTMMYDGDIDTGFNVYQEILRRSSAKEAEQQGEVTGIFG